MEPEFVTKAAFTVIGMKYRGKPEGDDIPQLWRAFGARMADIQDAVNPQVCYGLSQNLDPVSGEFDHVAAVEVGSDAPVPEGMIRLEVPKQTYAVFPCTLPTIPSVYEQIYQTWLPASGYQHAPGPEFELYDETFNPEDATSEFRVYMPVIKG